MTERTTCHISGRRAGLRRRASAPVRPGGAQGVLGLQRSAGNRAVRALIQREEAAGYKAPADLKVGAVVLGPQLREDMAWIEHQSQQVEAKRPMLDGQMESLHMAADANGAAAVKQVDGLKSAMANLSGPKQEKVKAAMDHYIAAEPKLRATMLRVESGRKNIIAKTDEMRAAVAHQKGQEAKQDEKKAEKDLGDLQEKKKQTNEMISTFIDFAKILANPEEGFSKALSKGESMVGSTITDMALGNTYVEQIAAAQQRLSALQSKVESLEDEEVMARVSGAVAELDKARTDLEATLTDLQGATNDAAIAESDLEKELGGLGKAGKAADDAIDEGDAMVQTGNDAAALSHDLRERVDGMDERIHRIERGIDRYEEMMDHADLSSDDATDDHQSVVQDRRASTAWSDYIKRQEKDLNEADAFIAKGSYRKPYQEGIDSALTKVRQGL